jgi:predicted ATP-grasp superfamily ATP-dependent carboligase
VSNAGERSSPRKGAIVLGGAHGSLEIARSLGRRGIAVWFVTADNPLASLSRFIECSFRWRGPRDSGALAFLTDLNRRHGLDGWVLFAGSDDDVRFVAQNHTALGALFTLTTPAWDKIRWTHDKRAMNARADELGIAHPLTRQARSRDELKSLGMTFPVILKPAVREGRNAFVDAKAWRANDEATLCARYDEAKALVGNETIMIQELIPGDGTAQYSYGSVWHRGKPVASLVAQRRRQYPVEFGFTSTLVETIEQPQIEAEACRFLASLDYSGLVEVEFKYDARDRRYKILDVNARAWSWLALGRTAGVDFAALQWRLATGEAVAPQAARFGARWLYVSRDLAASIWDMLAGRLSPTAYLRSFRRPLALAVFAWDDPVPALLDLPLSAMRVAARWLARRKGAAAPPLQSAKLPT